MAFDFASLSALRNQHPAWRLLRSDHAPLIASFLHQAFIVPNRRGLAAADLVEALDDVLYPLRQELGAAAFPKAALAYLNDWAEPDKGWLRKFYQHTDVAQFDLTPAAEQAIRWLMQLTERQFVGTESRLRILFDLLKQMDTGSETDPARRIAELQQQRAALDTELARLQAGELMLLDDTAIKDRFQQFAQGAQALLGDFRAVEHNFRQLDRQVRERIALWAGSKGALLDAILGEHDAIGDSDQGKSFRAFWDFLLSSRHQEELTALLERVLALPAVVAMQPEAHLRQVHYAWLEAGEHTQRTVAQLSQQLRRFLDDRAWLENRRIMVILQSIESKALAVRQTPPSTPLMEIAELGATIELPLDRPLFTPPGQLTLTARLLATPLESMDTQALFAQTMLDKTRLEQHIRRSLQATAQVSLAELVAAQPLAQGLAELVAYLQLGVDRFKTTVVEDTPEPISWQTLAEDGGALHKTARLPRIIFVR